MSAGDDGQGLSPLATLFVLLVGFVLPVLAWRSRRPFAEDAPGPPPTRRAFYVSAFFTQLMTLGLALLVAREIGMDVLGPFRVEPLAWLATVAVMGLLLATLPARWRSRSPASRRRQAVMVPRTPPQNVANVALCLLAGIGEEITFRGVLHACLWWMTGSWWLATVLCSVAFGVAHAIQGPRSMLIVAGVAFWMHVTVLWTGSLHLAMFVHAVYDLITTFTIARWVRRDETEQPAVQP
jgi:membrane protease YdiL (CAAX protease family)